MTHVRTPHRPDLAAAATSTIFFDSKEDNYIKTISKSAGFHKHSRSQWVYYIGAADWAEGTPPLSITIGRNLDRERLAAIDLLLVTNGVEVVTGPYRGKGEPDKVADLVCITIRHDLKDNTGLCAAIVQTVIAVMEGDMTVEELNPTSGLGIPRTAQYRQLGADGAAY